MNCKNCGTSISDNMDFCPNCGTKADKSKNDSSITCPTCETVNPVGAERCIICNAELPKNPPQQTYHAQKSVQQQSQVFCIHCGAPNDPSSTFCQECGKNLNEKVAPPVPPVVPPHKEKSYTPIIIVLVIVAILSIAGAIYAVSDGTFFVFESNSLSLGEHKEETPAPTQDIPEETPEPTIEPTETPRPTPSPSPTPTPTPRPTATPYPTSYDSYSIYRSYNHAFSCPYPSDMYETAKKSDFTELCLRDYDGGEIYICGTINDNGRDINTVISNFESSYPGYNVTGKYEVGSNYSFILRYSNGKYVYCYHNLSEGMIRGFEIIVDTEDYTKYVAHAEYMRNNISL